MKNRYPVIPSDAVKVLYDNSLSISHTAVNDAAYYTCVASNVAGKDEDSTVLNIGSKKVQFCIVLLDFVAVLHGYFIVLSRLF